MAFVVGTRIGPYEVTGLLGEGGMGQVYRARDTKLNRDVAVKVLSDAFTHDPDRLQRFTREAQVLASLNHPNIAAIYAIEDLPDSSHALVMELVEGPTLDALIQTGTAEAERAGARSRTNDSAAGPGGGAPGKLIKDDALRIARQIAEALEAAHEQGVIHRDLKPANIKVKPDGTVKVLDFGLAKALVANAASSSAENSPTITSPAMTAMGMVLGTAAYMSPEQARGKAVDKRADIWAFGVVLFEMLTGQRVFKGEDISLTMAAVLTQEPDWRAMPADIPGPLRRLLTRCLKKDPKARLRDIGEARLLLDDLIAGVGTDDDKTGGVVPRTAGASPSDRPARLPWLLAALGGAATLAALVAIWMMSRVPAPAPDLVRLEIPPPPNGLFDNALILSPDGRHIAFTATPTSTGTSQIWVRSLDRVDPRPIAPWSLNPVPFWSGDSRFIAYQQDGKLRKVDIAGGPVTTISDAPTGFAGGAWNRNNIIVFGDRNGGLKQVSSTGGVPAELTTLDRTRKETSHALPSFLPDGRHFVYLRRSVNDDVTGIYVGEIGIAPDKQDTTRLIASDTAAIYTPAPDPRDKKRGGFLLFIREGTLMAQPFDASARVVTGEPVPITEGVVVTSYGFGRFGASENGTLLYATGSSRYSTPTLLTWFDRKGKDLGNIGPAGRYLSLSISPDGSRVAAEKSDGLGSDLWLIDTNLGGRSDRFTFETGTELAPVWSPTGAEIVFAMRGKTTTFDLFKKPANLSGESVQVFASDQSKVATDWSRDGKTIVFSRLGGTGEIQTLAVDSAKEDVFLSTESAEYRGRLSPDGRWMAYVSEVTGRAEVYVRAFPPSADRPGQQMISTSGGNFPLWRRDGKELFYRRPGPVAVMSVDVTPAATFKAGPPKELFVVPDIAPVFTNSIYDWDVTADGQKFLLTVRDTRVETRDVVSVVLNWTEMLRR